MSRRIALDPRQPATEVPQTLLHELLHAIGFTLHIDVLKDDEGATVDRLAHALLTMLRDNKKLTDFLIGGKL